MYSGCMSLELLSLFLFFCEVELHSVVQVSLNPALASPLRSVLEILYVAQERLIVFKKEMEENYMLFCYVKSVSRVLV